VKRTEAGLNWAKDHNDKKDWGEKIEGTETNKIQEEKKRKKGKSQQGTYIGKYDQKGKKSGKAVKLLHIKG